MIRKTLITTTLSTLLSMGAIAPAWAGTEDTYRVSPEPTLTSGDWQQALTMEQRRRLEASYKDPATAAVLSTLLFGTGQMYAGDLGRGFAILGGAALLIGGGVTLINNVANKPEYNRTGLIVPLVAVSIAALWVWNIRDAYTFTEEFNSRVDKQIELSNASDRLAFLKNCQIGIASDEVALRYQALQF